MTLTIDTVNIASYGFTLLAKPDIHTLPPCKDIISQWSDATELNYHQEYDIELRLVGEFSTTALMTAAISNLDTLLKATIDHAIAISEISYSATGVSKNGFKTRIVGHKYNCVEITLKFTITT